MISTPWHSSSCRPCPRATSPRGDAASEDARGARRRREGEVPRPVPRRHRRDRRADERQHRVECRRHRGRAVGQTRHDPVRVGDERPRRGARRRARTLRFAPAQDYRGAASVTFEVTDGKSAGRSDRPSRDPHDPDHRRRPDFNDTPPTFTPRTETIEAGEAPLEIDLRSIERPAEPRQHRAHHLHEPRRARPPTSRRDRRRRHPSRLGTARRAARDATRLTFDVNFNEFTVPGYVDVKVVSSTRAAAEGRRRLPSRCSARDEPGRRRARERLQPVRGRRRAPARGRCGDRPGRSVGTNASVSYTATGITVRTGPAFTGTLSVIYRIEDGTRDPARRPRGESSSSCGRARRAERPGRSVEGRSVRDDPLERARAEQLARSTCTRSSYNGAVAAVRRRCRAAWTRPSAGLTNGTTYTFMVRAHNAIGWSAWSNPVRRNAIRPAQAADRPARLSRRVRARRASTSTGMPRRIPAAAGSTTRWSSTTAAG